MKLILKFNLVFLVLFLLAIGACGYVSHDLLQRNAREEVAERARLIMANSQAVRKYTSDEIKPLLDTQIKYTFVPQRVSAYSALRVFKMLTTIYPEYGYNGYREPTTNPTNPEDLPVDWERDIIENFRSHQDVKEVFGERAAPTGQVLFFARPMKVTSESCLECHSTPSAAPPTMLDKYPTNGGFGWQLNQIVGAQVVSVPTAVPQARAEATFRTFMISLGAVLIGIGLVLNLLLWWMFIRPVTRIASLADRVSMGELDAPDFVVHSRDEIRTLAESLMRLRKSMVIALQEGNR